MNTNSRSTYLLAESIEPTKWEQALYAFLAGKHRRTGSMRTVQSYSRILNAFFGGLHKTPDQVVSAEAMAFCFGKGARTPRRAVGSVLVPDSFVIDACPVSLITRLPAPAGRVHAWAKVFGADL